MIFLCKTVAKFWNFTCTPEAPSLSRAPAQGWTAKAFVKLIKGLLSPYQGLDEALYVHPLPVSYPGYLYAAVCVFCLFFFETFSWQDVV